MLSRILALAALVCLTSSVARARDECSELQAQLSQNNHDLDTAESASRASQQHLHDLKGKADWLLQKAKASNNAADWKNARDAQAAYDKTRPVEVNWIATDSANIGRLSSENIGIRSLMQEKNCIHVLPPQKNMDATCDRQGAENAALSYEQELEDKLPGKPEDRDPDDQAWIDMNLEPLTDKGLQAMKQRDWNGACADYRKALANLIARSDLPRGE